MPKINIKFFIFVFGLAVVLGLAGSSQAKTKETSREHLVYWPGTPQELEVYKIHGREDGPTVMIMGGIQGDESGGFLSADLYADLALKKGHLIVVPRASFQSIVFYQRGANGDMNRKFNKNLANDPDQPIVETLKALMAESDLLLNLHDGSGYYRPTWESDIANPNRYGQCIIADTAVYTHPENGEKVVLEDYAQSVINRVNQEITNPQHKFHFFNTETGANNSKYKEQRGSATFYALTQLGIPAFGVETSKQLPSLEMKIHQHNLAVNAFLDLFGVEIEQPAIKLDPPVLSCLTVALNNELPAYALANDQTLMVNPGDSIEIIQVVANFDRGLTADVQGLGEFNDIGRPLKIDKPTSIIVRRDQIKIGQINIGLKTADQPGPAPLITGSSRVKPVNQGSPVLPQSLPQARAQVTIPAKPTATDPPASSPEPPAGSTESDVEQTQAKPLDSTPTKVDPPTDVGQTQVKPLDSTPTKVDPPTATTQPLSTPNQIIGFLLEIDDQPIELAIGELLTVLTGSKIKIVDFKCDGPPPAGVVMNLRGFVPKAKRGSNDGDDRGFTADTAQDMMSAFSAGQKGQIYPLNAERGKEVLASARIKLVQPKLAMVTLIVDGQTKTLKLGGRLNVPSGGQITISSVKLAGEMTLTNPKFTLAGRPFPSSLPQDVEMPGIPSNLAVFNGETLAGKVTLVPK